MRSGADLTARRALAAPAVGAQQRRREGPRRDRPAGTRRPGEQPGVRHRAGDGVAQLRDDRLLPGELVEDAAIARGGDAWSLVIGAPGPGRKRGQG